MEVQSSPIKRNYDITMSRRTRKQSLQVQASNEKPPPIPMETRVLPELKEDQNENVHKSLKKLTIGDEKDAIIHCSSDEGEGKRGSNNSLGEHFIEEEKHLQLVRMQQKDNLQGMKLKKLVRRYAKVLGQLMKAKRDPHLGESGKKTLSSDHPRKKK
ncbi:PREDICTED: uncharacterized protein LOC109356443 [Lupinus angustifolius]|uniref:uncharacterized protein LOC109356443 n=1 Tax=Lupinus angustifolius TaxID=3871 RepID=UPI00092E63AA|nr:PREDICTED: uncharacterized protein LOC109356443 [Lupinus angustifolius]